MGIRAGSQTPGDLVKIVLIKLLPVNLSPKKEKKKERKKNGKHNKSLTFDSENFVSTEGSVKKGKS